MILTSLIITIIYLFLIGKFIIGFNKVSIFKLTNTPAKTQFSILIPFRNEAENLPALLESINALNYPNQFFEIIFIDDNSEDNSAEIVQKTSAEFKLILNNRQTKSPKKDAITSAIKKAKYEWIITTDADCIIPKYWLDSFNEYIQKNDVVSIAAPVAYIEEQSFLDQFQILDILSLQGATIGGFGINKPFLCNGANFAYKKSIFKKLNGFKGNTNVASGDDIFLLEKIAKAYPKQLHYLKCQHAIIKTKSQPYWNALFSQRVRWSAKTSQYNNWFGKVTGLVVLLINLLIITNLILTCFGVINIKILFYILVIKFSIDFFLVYKSASFFNQKHILKSYALGFIVYPFFSVYIAIASLFLGYKWKDRYFKK
ncbi:glycosyltransferase [uncultured Algibacter sp.]|uniref:glycosyltransferase n=1 Tax=uncultured Algibacter sp. TaxID=298659 RepID=UPI00262BDB7F|nr:glycosyltransferase [uncultured Algibacter sp.]